MFFHEFSPGCHKGLLKKKKKVYKNNCLNSVLHGMERGQREGCCLAWVQRSAVAEQHPACVASSLGSMPNSFIYARRAKISQCCLFLSLLELAICPG